MTAPPETSTPVGRLRTAVLCAHDPKGLGEDAQDWLFSVLRDDLPVLLELYQAYIHSDSKRAGELLERLDGAEVER